MLSAAAEVTNLVAADEELDLAAAEDSVEGEEVVDPAPVTLSVTDAERHSLSATSRVLACSVALQAPWTHDSTSSRKADDLQMQAMSLVLQPEAPMAFTAQESWVC